MPTPSARLRRKLDLAAPAFVTPGQMLLAAPNARELCPHYLAAGSYVTLAMVPLMQVALESSHSRSLDDPVAIGLAKYLERHIPEELHGGAPGRAMLADLEALGVDTTALRTGPLPPKTVELIGTLFFWIWHRHPVAILGFLALEAFHPHAPTVERLIEKTGLPRDGFRQLLLHAKLDAHHAKELHRVLDSLPLRPPHEELIALSALHTMAAMTDAWLDVVADPQRSGGSVASPAGSIRASGTSRRASSRFRLD